MSNKIEKSKLYSRKSRKFLTSADMADVKRTEAVHNSEMKRKGRKGSSNYVRECGCGDPTCIAFFEGPEHGVKKEKKKKSKKQEQKEDTERYNKR